MAGQPTGRDWLDAANNPGSDAVVPFSNGSEEMAWSDRNCDRCRRSIVTRDPANAPLKDYKWFEQQVLDGQECGARYCLDLAMVTGHVHRLAILWMGGSGGDMPSSCRHRTTRPGWEPPPPPEHVSPDQFIIPFKENFPLIDLNGLAVTSRGIFEEEDLNRSK